MQERDRVKVIGPVGCPATVSSGKRQGPVPASAQLGKSGVVLSISNDCVVVLLDDTTRPRNFKLGDLEVL